MKSIDTKQLRQVAVVEFRINPITDSPEKVTTGYRLQSKWLVAEGKSYQDKPNIPRSPADIDVNPSGHDYCAVPMYQPVREEWRDIPIVNES